MVPLIRRLREGGGWGCSGVSNGQGIRGRSRIGREEEVGEGGRDNCLHGTWSTFDQHLVPLMSPFNRILDGLMKELCKDKLSPSFCILRVVNDFA